MLKKLGSVFGPGNESAQRERIALGEAFGPVFGQGRGAGLVAPSEQIVNHALQTQCPPIVGGVEARDAVGVEFGQFVRVNGATPATENSDIRPVENKLIVEVFEKFEVTALVTRHRHRLHVFLNGRFHDVADRTVVTQMNHFDPTRLQQTPHQVDGRVVPIEQRTRRENTEGVFLVVKFRVGRGRSGVGRMHVYREKDSIYPRSPKIPRIGRFHG